MRRILLFNNTLLGRMLLGPLISQISFLRADARLIRAGDRAVLRGWILHLIGVGPPVWWLVQVGALPVWAYLAAAYGALSLLKIRTFLEHRADRRCGARTVIVEDKGPLALLFLNNNLHLVHHRRPKAAWYRLPALYDADKEHHLGHNGHYLYRSYRQIFARHLLRRKDPVPHPLWKG